MSAASRWFHWLPRALCILAILFVSLFALDAFAPDLTLAQQVGAFLIHLIPSFVLLAFLVVAWKWELVGWALLLAAGLGLSPFVFVLNYHRTHSIGVSLGIILIITLPFALVGTLFILSHRMRRRALPAT
jgi:hypothetical protein